MAHQINESSTMTVRVRIYDSAHTPTVADSVQYLIRDLTNNRVVRDWTSVAPALEMDIEVDAADNVLLPGTRQNRRFEKRVFTVRANTAESTQIVDEFEYWLKNLRGLEN